jgi:hypothetical protein
MTRDEIMNMPAGREMDTLVAKHVIPGGIYTTGLPVPKFSTDISAAWQVFKNKKVVDWFHDIEPQDSEIIQIIGAAEDSYSGATIITDKAPLAICRAALLAFMDARP